MVSKRGTWQDNLLRRHRADKQIKKLLKDVADYSSAVNIVDHPVDGDVGGRDTLEEWDERFPAGENQSEQNTFPELSLYHRQRHFDAEKEGEIGQELTQLTTEREQGKTRQKLTEPGRWDESYTDSNKFEDPDLKLGESNNDDTDPLSDAVYPPYTDGIGQPNPRYEDADKNKHNVILHATREDDGRKIDKNQLWICVDLDNTILEAPEEYQDKSGNHIFGQVLPGKGGGLGPEGALKELIDGGARVSIYTARQYFEDDPDKLIDQLTDHLNNLDIPYSDIYIGKKPPSHYFVDDRTIPAFDGDWELVLDTVRDKLTKTADDEVKNVKNINGLEFHVEWPKGSIRSYEGDDTYVTHMKADYGYIYGVDGTDGDQLDVYLGDDLNSSRAFIIEQVKEDGSYDEDKVMLGFTSEEEAVDIYLQHMPAFMFGNIREVPFDKLIDAIDPNTLPEDRSGQDDLIPSEEKQAFDLNKAIKKLRERKTDPYNPDPDSHLSDLEWLRKRTNKAGFKFMADKQPGEKVGLFIPLPEELAKQYPSEGKAGEDDSDPHLTILYIGEVPPEKFDDLIKIVEEELSDINPFELILGPVNVFVNHEDQEIFHSTIQNVNNTKLKDIHDSVRKRLLDEGFDVKHASRDFKAHITLEYVNPGDKPKFADVEPEGSWLVDQIEIWGLGEPYIVDLQDNKKAKRKDVFKPKIERKPKSDYVGPQTSQVGPVGGPGGGAIGDKESTQTWPEDDIFENMYTDGVETRENRDINRKPETERLKYRNT